MAASEMRDTRHAGTRPGRPTSTRRRNAAISLVRIAGRGIFPNAQIAMLCIYSVYELTWIWIRKVSLYLAIAIEVCSYRIVGG